MPALAHIPVPAPAAADSLPPLGPESFNERAASWDADPRRRETAAVFAREIADTLPLAPHWDVLDYGCGTAALALHLLPRVLRITAADAAGGMLAEVWRKRAALPAADAERLQPLLLNLDETPAALGSRRFHLVIASLVLHHVKNIPALLAAFARHLRPDGHVVITEFVKNPDLPDLAARPDLRPNPLGFEPDELATLLAKFVEPARVAWRTVYYFTRDNGFSSPVFLLRASRLAARPCPSAASCSAADGPDPAG
jgi:SAM-dependent methyltransferase